MQMSEALIIAVPAAVGLTIIAPKKSTPAITFLLASLSTGFGLMSLNLDREGQYEAALTFDMASMMLSLLSLAKSLELI